MSLLKRITTKVTNGTKITKLCLLSCSSRASCASWFAIFAVTLAACDKAQLLAPTKSTITLSAPARVLPTGGSTEVTASVVEEAGTPVQNGTTVRFSASLGRVDPVEVQTRNGLAITTFFAMNTSGVARITATSGGATGGGDDTNVLEITIGAAAVNTITLRASPGSVAPGGGTVELIATVVGENGRALEGIGVTFNTDQGTFSATTALTDPNGQARVTLTTTQKATVSATAGTKTSSNVTVDLRSGPIVTITCAPTSGTGNCSSVQASAANNTASVLFTIEKASGSSTLRTVTLDFGDGGSEPLGNLGGKATVVHTYNGPSDNTSRTYTATVSAVDINGEATAARTTVIITPKATVTPINVTIDTSSETATAAGQRWTFTANVTGGGESGTGNATIESFKWNFGDDSGEITTSGNKVSHVYDVATLAVRRTVKVTVRTQDGRTASSQTEIIVSAKP